MQSIYDDFPVAFLEHELSRIPQNLYEVNLNGIENANDYTTIIIVRTASDRCLTKLHLEKGM